MANLVQNGLPPRQSGDGKHHLGKILSDSRRSHSTAFNRLYLSYLPIQGHFSQVGGEGLQRALLYRGFSERLYNLYPSQLSCFEKRADKTNEQLKFNQQSTSIYVP